MRHARSRGNFSEHVPWQQTYLLRVRTGAQNDGAISVTRHHQGPQQTAGERQYGNEHAGNPRHRSDNDQGRHGSLGQAAQIQLHLRESWRAVLISRSSGSCQRCRDVEAPGLA